MQSTDIQWIPYARRMEAPRIEDVYREARARLQASGAAIQRGERIGIAVGSRGIANIDRLAKACVDHVREAGGEPFLLPAMGSHGGATAEGQRQLIEGYGVTEQAMGARIVSSLDVVKLDTLADNFNCYLARDAMRADGVIVINRVKPHTDFHGPVESGLMKMLVIGLGKHAQAIETHAHGTYGLRELIPLAAARVLRTGKIRIGLGVVENALDETMAVSACPGEGIPALDSELLQLARQNMPRLPVDALDLLVVDRIGKDISGTCLDTNVIGRIRIDGESEPASPEIRALVGLSLTEASHGNALGVGLCDVVTKQLRDAIDFDAMYENVVTSSFLRRGNLPPVARDEGEAIDWALRMVGIRTPETLRAIRIRDTLHLSDMLVTPAVLKEIEA